ncbi:hypothetical protein ERJ75_001038000 [Trypanosoma vivax]|nr:hypothetical protein ERJ75_001038000 [Trypanosoma vivax]
MRWGFAVPHVVLLFAVVLGSSGIPLFTGADTPTATVAQLNVTCQVIRQLDRIYSYSIALDKQVLAAMSTLNQERRNVRRSNRLLNGHNYAFVKGSDIAAREKYELARKISVKAMEMAESIGKLLKRTRWKLQRHILQALKEGTNIKRNIIMQCGCDTGKSAKMAFLGVVEKYDGSSGPWDDSVKSELFQLVDRVNAFEGEVINAITAANTALKACQVNEMEVGDPRDIVAEVEHKTLCPLIRTPAPPKEMGDTAAEKNMEQEMDAAIGVPFPERDYAEEVEGGDRKQQQKQQQHQRSLANSNTNTTGTRSGEKTVLASGLQAVEKASLPTDLNEVTPNAATDETAGGVVTVDGSVEKYRKVALTKWILIFFMT